MPGRHHVWSVTLCHTCDTLCAMTTPFNEIPRARSTGQIVGMSVAEYCPRNQPLLDRFVAVYGDKAAVA